MAFATANRAQLRYIQETVFGVTPAVGPHKALRFAGESLSFGFQTDTSKEIRSDRQVTDLILVGASAQGGVNYELSYREFDTLISGAMQNDWVEYGTNGIGTPASVSINSTAGTLTWGSAPTGNDALTGGSAKIAVGQWIRINAPSDAADKALVKVASLSATTITVDTATPIPGTGTRSSVANVSISTSRITNGTVEKSFSIERGLMDPGSTTNGQFFNHRGMSVSKMSMSFQSGSVVNGSFDFMGKDVVRSQTNTTLLPGVTTASQSYDVMNAVNGVGNILEAGVALTGTFIKSLKLDVDNKLRGRDAMGTLGNVSVGTGTLEVSGDMEVYLADGTMYDKFVNQEASSLTWSTRDAAGNGYVFTFPKIKFKDAKVQAGGLDQDVMLSVPFTAIFDPTTGKTFIIDRIGA